jgi:hypothetical protein
MELPRILKYREVFILKKLEKSSRIVKKIL